MSVTFGDSRPVQCHLDLKAEGKDVVNAMPEYFTSINQARVYLDFVIRTSHFIRSLSYNFSHAQYEMLSLLSKEVPWMDSKFVVQATSKHESKRDVYNAEMNKWLRVFKPLLSKCFEKQDQNYISVLIMLIGMTTAFVSLGSSSSRRQITISSSPISEISSHNLHFSWKR
jgi:hypothetical protein